ncbi:TonB-dependent receptor [Sphingomonas sp. HF-S4]|uniref:TonB-dependent receptor n=1 Tax=Sphingomonas agrestis TaxID=3080540 RepID=A0ABU3Y1X4_9SPHN|nr:TonB-dependent receptor [Sphingomonas sp. HF-S4]MDV3455376.1 TonB-dependent receptor [Sphingomonas sp. HF-S4]
MGHFTSGRRRAAGSAFTASIALSALTASAPASAQDVPANAAATPEESTGEIVVTGTRRGDASVTDTALAITAFSGETLERNHVTTLSDLRNLDPSVNIQSFGAAQTKVVLRGIDSDVGATSALYLNEAAVLGGTGGNILGDGKPGVRLHDIDHVEVLKGPQGTLFGTSSMSGTLRVLTRKPELETWGGSAELGLAGVEGGNPFGEASATLNVPVAPTVAVRVTGWLEAGGGFIDQQVGNRATFENNNDQYVRGVRGEALWQPSVDFSLRAMALHQAINVDGNQAFQQAAGPYLNTSPTVEFYKDKYSLFSLTGDYDLGFASIIASGNYSKQDVLNAKDSTPTNISFGVNAPLSFVARIDFEDYNGELRFSSKFDGPFQIVAGAYYEHTTSVYQTNAIQAPNFTPACLSYEECKANGLANAGRGNSIYEFGTSTARTIDQYALYAQGDLEIVPGLTATVGGRYFRAEVRDVVTNLQTVFPDFVFGVVTTPSITGDRKGTNTKPSYNAALLWEATPNVSLYARAASGFRIGGVNTATSLAQQAGVNFPGNYAPDSLWSYEAGVKGYLFDRALFFDLSGYRVDWTNQQLSASAAGAFGYTINAGKTVTKGIEFNTRLNLPSGFSFTGNVTYVDAKLAEDLPADVVAAGTFGEEGDRVPLSPRWSAAASANYDVALSDRLTGFVSGNVTYHGDSYSSFSRATAFDTYLPEYTMFGAKIGMRTQNGVEFTLYGDNLGNEAPYLGVVPSQDGVRVFTARPRTYGLRVRSSF